MKKSIKLLLVALLGLFIFTACDENDEPAGTSYYLAGSFNHYNEKDKNYLLSKVKGEEGKYTITVELTEENRDQIYDGHYYKITEGSWDADKCFGVSNYYIDPAPVSPTGGGLGSVWHWANGTLVVVWDENEKLITDTLTIDEDIIEDVFGIYGKFNGWNISGEQAILLEDNDGDGIYEAKFEILEAITSDVGFVLNKKWFDDQWGQRWGAEVQYKLDGTVAGMGDSSEFEFEEGHYFVIYNSKTKVTTIEKLEKDLEYRYHNPRIYGEFNGWKIDNDEDVFFLTDADGDGVYEGVYTFSEEVTSDFSVVLSKKYYDDDWGKRWGAEEQYTLAGEVSGMGVTNEETFLPGTYLFLFDVKTKKTSYHKLEAGLIIEFNQYRVYGEFNGWKIDNDEDVFFLTDADGDGVYEGVYTFSEEVTSDFSVVLSKKYYDDDWGQRWGAEEQYTLAGEVSGMGVTNEETFSPGTYLFLFDAKTKKTSYHKLEDGLIIEFNQYRVYGEFNVWDAFGENAVLLEENEEGLYVGYFEVLEDLETDFLTVLSKKWFDDEWGQRWGVEEQYNFDGSTGSMSNPKKTITAGKYKIIYNPKDNTTTLEIDN
jgi:hypothetical protein